MPYKGNAGTLFQPDARFYSSVFTVDSTIFFFPRTRLHVYCRLYHSILLITIFLCHNYRAGCYHLL